MVSAAPASAGTGTGAPAGFAPGSTSWTSPTAGWVLGVAACGSASCTQLVRTTDGGSTWERRVPPTVSQTVDQTRVVFADGHDGWATDGDRLLVTHDGATTWHAVRLPGVIGSSSDVDIHKIAAGRDFAYAIVSDGIRGVTRTRLYATPVDTDDWQPVPGVLIAGSGGWDVATNGSRTYVSLGVVHESTRMWSAADGRTFVERSPLCDVDSAVRLSAPTAGSVYAMCSSNPFRGSMQKVLVSAADTGRPMVLGEAPWYGITTAFAATAEGSAFVSGVGMGATWLHASFDDGATWESPLIVPDVQLPMSDLQFPDAATGVAVYGGPKWSEAVLYRTADGGHTWSPVTF
jgi:photosystem II stability/assembly factor-like uncharacterized protein